MEVAVTSREEPAVAPSVSVVISTHTEERWNDLLDAIESVSRQTYPARETIVVVDRAPHLLARLEAEKLPLRMVANTDAPGLCGARNTGVAVAEGDIVAFLDDDATAAPNWLQDLVRSYMSENVLGVGGAIEAAWTAGRPSWFPRELDWVVGCTYRGLPRRTARVRNMIGANMSFRRLVFEQIGGFRAELGRSGRVVSGGRTADETEFCIRASASFPGGIFIYEPAAQVRHRVPPERGDVSYLLRRCYVEGVAKARVARIAGMRSGLSPEAAYLTRTLPQGLLGGLRDGIGGDLSGFGRAGAILAGVAATTVGFAVGTASALVGRGKDEEHAS